MEEAENGRYYTRAKRREEEEEVEEDEWQEICKCNCVGGLIKSERVAALGR